MSPDACPPTGSAEQIHTFIAAQTAVRTFCHANGYDPDDLGTASAHMAADALTAILVELEDRGAVEGKLVASTYIGNSGLALAHTAVVGCLGERAWVTDPMDNIVLAEIIACGMVTGWATVIVARSTGADGRQTAYGWHVRDCAFVPLTEAETFAGYATDSATGEPAPRRTVWSSTTPSHSAFRTSHDRQPGRTRVRDDEQQPGPARDPAPRADMVLVRHPSRATGRRTASPVPPLPRAEGRRRTPTASPSAMTNHRVSRIHAACALERASGSGPRAAAVIRRGLTIKTAR